MGKPQRRFTKEFEAQAVRLLETRGCTQRKIAEDLAIGVAHTGVECEMDAPSPER